MNKGTSILIFFIMVSFFSVCFTSTVQSPSTLSSPYQILKLNLHAHTNYSDGTYSPSELVDIYKNAGYDVLGISDHGTVAGYAEALSEGKKVGLIVVCGEEVSCSWSDGSWKHVLALFINESIGITEGSDVEVKDIFDAIHAQNGIGIVAHPWFSWDNWETYTNEGCIDGWEVDYSMSWVLESDYIYMLGHDFHNTTFLELLPNYCTYVLAENRTEAGVKDALMEKRIVVYGDGSLYGSTYALQLYFENLETPSPTNPVPPTATAEPTASLTPTPNSSNPSPSDSPTASPNPTDNAPLIFPSEVVFDGWVFGIAVIAIIVLLVLRKRKR